MKEHRVRVSSKGQVVIPKEIRKEYGISTGTELTLRPLDENSLVFEKVPKLSELFGLLGRAKTGNLLERERKKEEEVERKRNEELRRAMKISPPSPK